MSTTKQTIEHHVGWLRELVPEPLGSALVADAPVGATQLEVVDAVDFDEAGGTLRLNGQIIGYASSDADAETILLNGPLAIAADADDMVEVWDTDNAMPAADIVGLVELLNTNGDDDPVPAKLTHALSSMLPLGPRAGRGERVWVEQDGNDWRIVDILGKQHLLDLSAADPDSLGGAKPNPPAGLVLSSSVYVDAGVTRARVTADWDPVTQDVNGEPLTVADLWAYEVQIQPGAGSASVAWLAGATTPPEATQATMIGLLVGQQYAVRVRVARGGDTVHTWSDWSAIVSITAAADATPPNKPSTPGATSRLGVHTVTWDGKDYLGNPMPADFAYCELHRSTVDGFTPTPGDLTTLVYRYSGAGKFNTPGTYNVTDYFDLVAVDTSGNASTPSTQATSVVAPLVDVSNFPDTAMDTLYARTAHFIDATADNFAANKIQADWCDIGLLTAMLVRGAQMETHSGAFRGVKINDDGIKAYDSSGTNPTPTFQVDAVTGAVTMKGSLTSGSTITGTTITGSSFSTLGTYPVTISNGSLSWASGESIYSTGTAWTLQGPGSASVQITNAQVNVSGVLNATHTGDWSGGLTASGTVTGNRLVTGIGTSGSAANTYMDTAGMLLKSTSSRRHKYDIETAELDPATVLGLRPTTHRRYDDPGYDEADPGAGPLYLSLIAEEVAGLSPWLATYDEEGQPDGINWQAVSLYLIALGKNHEDRLSGRDGRMEALERRLTAAGL